MKSTIRGLTSSTIYFCVLSILIAGFNSEASAQAAQSDYQIQQDFKEKYRMLNDSLETVQDTETARRLARKVKLLETKYRDHRELLNKVLYPDTFEEELRALKQRTVSTQQRLYTIERQEAKLGELTEQLTSYDTRLTQLNSQTDSLRRAMERSVQSESQLSGLVRQYRENLEKRDDLILSFVDSMMVTYDQMNLESAKNMENVRKQAQITADGNALKMIEGIARENIEFLKSNTKLSTEEYLRMSAVQQQFQGMWKTLGNKMSEIYADNNTEEAKKQVDTAIREWNQIVTDRTWTSLNRVVEEEGLNIPDFGDRKAFYNNLMGYIDNALSESQDKATEEGYKKYQQFKSFWSNQVKVQWGEYLDESNLLTNRQIASVDQKLDEWAISAEPESGNLLVYLLGATVLAIVVLGVMLAREKSHHNHS